MVKDEKKSVPCINQIPICGGFCYESELMYGNEPHCLRHFSNERTLPGPCTQSHTARKCTEHPGCVRWVGSVGSCDEDEPWAHKNRTKIMSFAFGVSLLAWVFCLLSLVGLANNDAAVQRMPWAKITATFGASHVDVDLGVKRFVVDTAGVSTAAKSLLSIEDTVGIEWGDPRACNGSAFGMSGEHCAKCSHAAQNDVFSLAVVGALTQIFQMVTDLQRSTVHGDMNCQKVQGLVTGLLSLATSFSSLHKFADACLYSPPTSLSVGLDGSAFGSALPGGVDLAAAASTAGITLEEGNSVTLQMAYTHGTGFVLCWLAVALKIVDIICHLIVPTPKGRHAEVDGTDTLVEYMNRVDDRGGGGGGGAGVHDKQPRKADELDAV